MDPVATPAVAAAQQRRLLRLRAQLHPAAGPRRGGSCACASASSAVPIIDLSAVSAGGPSSDGAKAAVAAAIGDACATAGFFIVVGHGVDPQLIARAEAASRSFFDRPLEDKLPLRSPSPEISRGYVPLAAEAAAASNDGAEDEAGDLNEAFAIGPVDRIDTVDPSCALPPALPPPALQRKLCAAACAACCGCRLYCI
jgi:isopenicillin N synthase-like dioxygenase